MSQKIKVIIAFTAIYLIWGSTFFGVSIALKSFPPFILSTLRFLIGGLALLCYCYFKNEPLPGKKEIKQFSILGIILFGGGVVSVVWAQQYLPSSLASIIITTPFWFVILDKSQWHTNLRNAWIITGLTVGLAGVVLLLSQKTSAKYESISFIQIKPILVMIAGSFLWVAASLRIRNKQYKATVYARTATQLLSASVFAFFVSIAVGEYKVMNFRNIYFESVVSLFFLALISTTITFLAFVWLLNKKPAPLVSTYAYINPVVAVLLGVFIGKENITGLQLIAMCIILSGVFIINIPKYIT